MPTMQDARAALKERFGYDDFRPNQRDLVEQVLAGRDVLGVMPTGAGKSVCYQIPGVVMSGLALVISPLVSLMGDQVRSLQDAGIQAAYLNSTLTPSQQGSIMARALAGGVRPALCCARAVGGPALRGVRLAGAHSAGRGR